MLYKNSLEYNCLYKYICTKETGTFANVQNKCSLYFGSFKECQLVVWVVSVWCAGVLF